MGQLAEHPKRRDIQGLRAIAVLLVVGYHAGIGPSGGFVGVDVFFVVSGYVIGLSLLRELTATGRISYSSFYTRRVKRILPAFALATAVTVLLTPLLASVATQTVSLRTAIAGSLFNANNYLARASANYYDPKSELNPLLHIWSLSLEEQFYLLLPLVLVLGWRRRSAGHRSQLLLTTISLAVASLSLMFLLNIKPGLLTLSDGTARQLAFYSMPARAWEFVAGTALAVWSAHRLRTTTALARSRVGVGCGLIALCAVLLDESSRHPGLPAVMVVIGALLVLSAGDNVRSRSLGVLESRPLQTIGDLSYSWYLWHWPFITFATASLGDGPSTKVTAAVASLLPSYLSYRAIEAPIRSAPLKVRTTLGLAALCVVVPAVSAVAASTVSERLASRDYTEATREHTDLSAGCDSAVPFGSRGPDECRLSSPLPSRGSVLLIGDSNAGHLSEGLTAAAHAAQYDVTIATLSSCPFRPLLVSRLVDSGLEARCDRFVTESLRAIIQNPPNIVIVAASEHYLVDDGFTLRSANGEPAEQVDDRRQVWSAATAELIASLQSAGSRVVLVSQVPKDVVDPRRCSALRWMLGPRFCSGSVSRAEHLRRSAPAVQADQKVASDRGVTVLDPTHYLCLVDSCPAILSGTYLYRDAGHISVAGSLRLTPMFATIFD